MDSSLDEIIFSHSSKSDDVAFTFQTNSQYMGDPFGCIDINDDDQLKIESPIDCLEALNTTFSVEDFHWDASDDAMMDNTIPIWLFPAQNIPTSASACSTTTDSAIAAQMDTLFLPEKDYVTSYSMHNNLACSTDIAKSFVQFSVDSDHTSLDEERCHLANNHTHGIQGMNPLCQPAVSMKTPWIHRAVPPDSSVNTNNTRVDTTHNDNNYNSSNNHNNHNYSNSFLMATHLYRHQCYNASSSVFQGHVTGTIVSSSHTANLPHDQEHPYHTRKRKLHFSSVHANDENQETNYHFHPGFMQIFSDEEDNNNDNNDNDDDDDSEDSHQSNKQKTSLSFKATSKTMSKRSKKTSMKKQCYDYDTHGMENDSSKDTTVLCDRQQDVLRKLQSMVDSITDPVGKYMRKRNLTPMDAIKFNIHELLLQAPKKPRQRYGPRPKKKTLSTSHYTSDDLEDDNTTITTTNINNIDNNTSPNLNTRNNIRPSESQRHLPEEEEDNDGLEDVFRDEYADSLAMTQMTTMPRNETTRARNREHARATRRRRRIFKEIDSFLEHCNNNTKNNVDPLYLRHSSH